LLDFNGEKVKAVVVKKKEKGRERSTTVDRMKDGEWPEDGEQKCKYEKLSWS